MAGIVPSVRKDIVSNGVFPPGAHMPVDTEDQSERLEDDLQEES